MLVPNSTSRRKRNAKQSNRSLQIESLEHKRLLSSDGILPEPEIARLIAPGGVVAGTKWEDVNADARRDEDEVGLAGVVIYADANGNMQLDDDERWTTTVEDDPDTLVDESGSYSMWLEPGRYTIREVVPEGYSQTFPWKDPIFDPDAPDIIFVPVGGHDVTVKFASRQDGLDFGNVRIDGGSATIEGRTWNDANGNGKKDETESGLGGIEVYLDRNNNGEFDPGERSTRTLFEDPVTDFDEGGLYNFGGLRPGRYTVREVVPNGYVQTHPTIDGDVLSSETGRFQPGIALDLDLVDVSYSQADETKTSLTLSVQWPNGCGMIDANQTSFAVIGDTILVNAHGDQSGNICTEALIDTEIEVSIPGLDAGIYTVVGTLHEGTDATLGVVGEFEIGASGAHFVDVAAGGVASGNDFGNRRTGRPESVSGTKWNDKNGDSTRQRDEVGLGGVTIYVDANHNGQLDEGEISTVTSSDPNSLGTYQLVGLEPGYHEIREVVPEGYQQTFPYQWFGDIDLPVDIFDPAIGERIPFPFEGSHYVEVFPGDQIEGVNFGNQSTEPSSVSGTKWNDANGNGFREEDEAGLAGVTIYVDINGNWAFDEGEPSAVSNEMGDYKIGGIRPGTYAVREVVPEGYHQTFPHNDIWRFAPQEDRLIADPFWPVQQHYVTFQPGETVEGIDFGNQKIELGSIAGIKWNDVNGNGIREAEEAAIAGVTIYIDQNYNNQFDPDEPSTVTATDNPDTADDETGRYRFGELQPFTSYSIREVVPEGYEQTFPYIFEWPQPIFEGEDGITVDNAGDIALIPFPSGAHNIYVGSGQDVEQINFGNRKIPEPGFVTGIVWGDTNGNGKRDADESGQVGVQVFADANLNGLLDWNELSATTQADDPNTEANEAGQYTLKVRPGFHLILQSTQPGQDQTYPETSRRVLFPYNLGHSVTVEAGQTVDNVDFGNNRGARQGISGTTWFDSNANGVWDRGEEAENFVEVYLDQNDNGRLDRGEISTLSGTFNGTGDGVVASGSYYFDVDPGDHIVRQVVPFSYVGTYPNFAFELGESVSEPIEPTNAKSFALAEIHTASTSSDDRGQSETYLSFVSTWSATDVKFEISRVQIDGHLIEIEIIGDPQRVDGDVRIVEETRVNIGSLEMGDYQVIARMYESQDVPAYELHSTFVAYGDDAHRVTISANESVGGLNFGRIATPFFLPTDSRMGEDPHSHLHNETATPLEFHDGHAQLNSYVDADDDVDVFRFVGNGTLITGEGGRSDGGNSLTYEILDGDGATISMSVAGEPILAPTEDGETYYVRVSGAQGQYQLDLLQERLEPESTVLPGDTDGDGDVDFRDFLVLSSKFGSEVDAAFADGDFDGDGAVSFVDFLVLSQNFGRTA